MTVNDSIVEVTSGLLNNLCRFSLFNLIYLVLNDL